MAQAHTYANAPGPTGSFLRSASGQIAIDVGCGPGNLLAALAQRARISVGVDISDVSVRLARSVAEASADRVRVVQGNALGLPFRSACADIVVATGCLHHTGDAWAAFREVTRLLRPGGRGIVTVYRRSSYYHALYRTAARLPRWADGRPGFDRVVNRGLLMPAFWLYFWVGRLVTHRRVRPPSYGEARNYFADQLLNPVVTFHTEADVRGWAETAGVVVEQLSTSHAGALLNATIARPVGSGSTAG
ncbi:MAG: class I SAM-dependent methyltransferase [Actinomycetota bacterium]